MCFNALFTREGWNAYIALVQDAKKDSLPHIAVEDNELRGKIKTKDILLKKGEASNYTIHDAKVWEKVILRVI